MRITLLAVGKLKASPERDLVDDYMKRANAAGRALGFRQVSEYEVAGGGGLMQEGARLIERVPKGALAVRLDEGGDNITSEAFAARLAHWRDGGTADAVLMIGGAEGYDEAVRAAFAPSIAFGVQTWPHRLVRVMLAEQIYRAMTILAGTPYHKA